MFVVCRFIKHEGDCTGVKLAPCYDFVVELVASLLCSRETVDEQAQHQWVLRHLKVLRALELTLNVFHKVRAPVFEASLHNFILHGLGERNDLDEFEGRKHCVVEPREPRRNHEPLLRALVELPRDPLFDVPAK